MMKPAYMRSSGWVSAVLLLAACSANTEPVGGASRALEIEGLPRVEASAVLGASDGCEGVLNGGESFVVDANLLVVAVRDDEPVCIDTLEAIAEELRTLALADRAELIADAYARTANTERRADAEGMHLTTFTMPNAGDPNPEPNNPPNAGDPNPEPNRPRGGMDDAPSPVNDGRECGDPNPEPNSPGLRPLPSGVEALSRQL
jgi:hypothetical protein